MKTLKQLFDNNRQWAKDCLQKDPQFFEGLSKIQRPHYLWIGCSDSRVPANEIVGLPPGELFVHRNVANIVSPTDLNCLSVVEFAVKALSVREIIVCGHYGCGGVQAALEKKSYGISDQWIAHVQNVAQRHQRELDATPSMEARSRLLCELNVREQVQHLSTTAPIQEARRSGQAITIHGWIYDLHDGLLRDLNVTATLGT